MIVLMLVAVAVDRAQLFLARRELSDLAAGAANDASTGGLDIARFRVDGTYNLHPDRTDAVLRSTIAISDQRDRIQIDNTSIGQNPPSVTITLSTSVHSLFGGPFGPTHVVRATATAYAHLR